MSKGDKKGQEQESLRESYTGVCKKKYDKDGKKCQKCIFAKSCKKQLKIGVENDK